MRSNSQLIQENEVSIDCSRGSRAKSATRSPVAVAYEYIHIITNVFKVFLGIQPNKCSLLHNKKNHSTYFKQNEKCGLFGQTLAAIGMNETSQRGALHHHLCAWLGLQSRLLEAAAAFPDFVDEIAKVINSQFTAQIDVKHHVLELLTGYMKRSTISNKPKLTFIPPALQCRPCHTDNESIPTVDCTTFKNICSYNATRLNIHKHSFTCFKGTSGKGGCRMSFPQDLIETTKPIQIKVDDGKKDSWKLCENIISKNVVNFKL